MKFWRKIWLLLLATFWLGACASLTEAQNQGDDTKIAAACGGNKSDSLNYVELDNYHAATYHLPSFKLADYLMPEHHLVPGNFMYQYNGIESAIVRRMMGYYNSYVSKYLDSQYQNSNETPGEYQRILDNWSNAEADVRNGGRWWERAWNESLVPERGGAPREREIFTIGQELEAVSAGPASLSNEGKITIGNLGFYLDQRLGTKIGSRLASSFGAGSTNISGPSVSDQSSEVGINLIPEGRRHGWSDSENELPAGNFFTGPFFNVNIKTSFRLRLPQFGGSSSSRGMGSIESQAIGTIGMAAAEVTVNFFYSRKHEWKEWSRLTMKVVETPRDRITEGTVSWEILGF